jgi:hypothetical protein
MRSRSASRASPSLAFVLHRGVLRNLPQHLDCTVDALGVAVTRSGENRTCRVLRIQHVARAVEPALTPGRRFTSMGLCPFQPGGWRGRRRRTRCPRPHGRAGARCSAFRSRNQGQQRPGGQDCDETRARLPVGHSQCWRRGASARSGPRGRSDLDVSHLGA